ncbi:GGDEF domain-containing protein [Parasalinivibrio latis]|uniref:GGDEF domain-containing protein n=1 Tax=Parasalinivibrio latis TaxID=2952610 RepID=UPI0030E5D5F7
MGQPVPSLEILRQSVSRLLNDKIISAEQRTAFAKDTKKYFVNKKSVPTTQFNTLWQSLYVLEYVDDIIKAKLLLKDIDDVLNSVNEQKQATLAEKEKSIPGLLENCIDNLTTMFTIRTGDGVHVYSNYRYNEFLGIDTAGISFAQLLELVPEENLEQLKICMQNDEKAFNSDVPVVDIEQFTKNGEICFYETIRQKIEIGDESLLILSAWDITNNIMKIRDAENLSRSSLKDDLTDCWSRKVLQDTAIVGHCNHCCFVDLDNFKAINDKYGHKEGDRILLEFAQILCSNLREEDITIRYGGDEFIILFKANDAEWMKEKMNNLRHHIEQHFAEHQISFSFGISMIAENFERAVIEADLNMYFDKRERKQSLETEPV